MIHRNIHQTDKIYRWDIIILPLAILPVIDTTGITYAPVKPVIILISLQFDNEHCT